MLDLMLFFPREVLDTALTVPAKGAHVKKHVLKDEPAKQRQPGVARIDIRKPGKQALKPKVDPREKRQAKVDAAWLALLDDGEWHATKSLADGRLMDKRTALQAMDRLHGKGLVERKEVPARGKNACLWRKVVKE